MLTRIIDFSLRNKFLVLVATIGLVCGGVYALRHIPLDAIPDLSDTQVIIYTEWPGQAPQLVQDQITYLLACNRPLVHRLVRSLRYALSVLGPPALKCFARLVWVTAEI